MLPFTYRHHEKRFKFQEITISNAVITAIALTSLFFFLFLIGLSAFIYCYVRASRKPGVAQLLPGPESRYYTHRRSIPVREYMTTPGTPGHGAVLSLSSRNPTQSLNSGSNNKLHPPQPQPQSLHSQTGYSKINYSGRRPGYGNSPLYQGLLLPPSR
jgi:hypothetical protein